MSNTLLDTVKTQLTKRAEAGMLSNSELLHIMELENRYMQPQRPCATATETDGPDFASWQESLEKDDQVKAKVHGSESSDAESSQPQQEEEVEAKPMSPTEIKKQEISEEIISLGGTPPEKGSLKKFQQALEELKVSQQESSEEEGDEEEDIDAFNDLMTKVQDLYDRLEEEEKIEDMQVVIEITKGINEKAESPDELSLSELKQFHKELKKLDK